MLRRGLHTGVLALAAGLGLAAPVAQAKTFFLMPTAATSWLVIDPASVESRPGGVVRRLWTVSVMKSIVNGDPPQPGYVRTQNDYDCASGETRWLSFQVYSRSGDLILTRDNPALEWTAAKAAPDVLAAHRLACEGVVNAAVSAESIGRLVINLMAVWDAPPAATTPGGPTTAAPAPKPPSAKAVSAAILPKAGPPKPGPTAPVKKPPAAPAAKAAAAPPKKAT